MASFNPIRSVTRALDVLAAMNRHAFCSLETLHQQTRIPRPTLVRILETLQSKGMVSRAPPYGTYCLTAEALTRKIKWPLALAVPDYDAVVVRYSTIPHSPLALLHSTLNLRVSLSMGMKNRRCWSHAKMISSFRRSFKQHFHTFQWVKSMATLRKGSLPLR